MICKNCGNQLNPGDIFCIKCGSAVANNLFSAPVTENKIVKEVVETVEELKSETVEPEVITESIPSIPDLAVDDTVESIDSNDESDRIEFVDNVIKEAEDNEQEFNKLLEDQQIELGFKQSYDDTNPEWEEVANDDFKENPEDMKNIERYFKERNEDISNNEFSLNTAQELASQEQIINPVEEPQVEEEPVKETTEEIVEDTVDNIDDLISDKISEEVETTDEVETENEVETIDETASAIDTPEEVTDTSEEIVESKTVETSNEPKIEQPMSSHDKKINTALNIAIGILSCITVYLGLQYFGLF